MRKTIIFFILTISHNAYSVSFSGNGYGTIPDGPGECGIPGDPLEITFEVSGFSNTIEQLSLAINMTHPSIDNLTVILEAPSGEQHSVFGKVGALNSCKGYSTAIGNGNNYIFTDWGIEMRHIWPVAEQGQGAILPHIFSYYTTESGGINQNNIPAITSLTEFGQSVNQINGTWKLIFIDDQNSDVGSVESVNLNISPDVTGQITDGNARALVGYGYLANFNIDETPYLSNSRSHFRTPEDTRELLLGSQLSAKYSENKAELYWPDVREYGDFSMKIIYELESTSETSAILYTTYIATNISDTTLNLNIFEHMEPYSHFTDEDIQMQLGQNPNTIEYIDVPDDRFSTYIFGGDPSYMAGTGEFSPFDVLWDQYLDDFQNTGLPYGPGNSASYAVQWSNINLEPSQSIIIKTAFVAGYGEVPAPIDPELSYVIFKDQFETSEN